MKLFKKTFVLLTVTTLILVTTGFGCKGASKAEKQASQPVTLEYWTVYDDVNAIKALIDEYKVQRTYLKVNVRQLGYDEIYNRLLEALSDDKGPDIISVNNRFVDAYLPKLQPMPATARDTLMWVEEGKFSKTTNINIQTKSLLTTTQLEKEYIRSVKKDVVRNGKIYGLPLSSDVLALYYNKDLLDRAGIPQPPKTWEEFQEDVKKLTKFQKSTGKILQSGAALGTGANIPASSDILYILFKQSNLPFVDETTNRAVFNGSGEGGSASIFNFYTDFANPARDTYTWNDTMPNALDSFITGSTAFFFGYNYHYPVIKGRAPQLNFDIVPMLQLTPDSRVNTTNYWLQAVTLKSKHPNEAWALIDYLAHSKANKKYLDQTNRPTALRMYISDQQQKPELAPFVEQILNAENWYHGKNYDAANKAIQDIYANWITTSAETDNLQKLKPILDSAAVKFNQTL